MDPFHGYTQMTRSSSLRTFSEYRAEESENRRRASVSREGVLLEYETLELRVHPPNIVVDNDSKDDCTVLTVDSANRPGTLVEVMLPIVDYVFSRGIHNPESLLH